MHTLRTKGTLSYIPEHIKICEDALAFRAKEKSAEDIFRIRLNTLKAIGGVFEGAIKGDAKLITDSARFIERERRVEQDMEKELWRWASWVLRHQVFSDDLRKQRRVLGRIIDNWPNQCRRVRNTLSHELIRKISSKTFVAYAIQNPMRAITSLLFTECMKIKLNAMPLSARRVRRKAAQSLRMA